MADLLAAAALLIAILAMLYGSWTTDVAAALNIAPPALKADREDQRKLISAAYYRKALPLMGGAVVLGPPEN